MKNKLISTYAIMRSFTLLFFLMYLITPLFSQVTIGSNEKPMNGALLDLKMDGTTTKGLSLPRVSLVSKTALYPMFENDSDYELNTNNKKDIEDMQHVGLVLYNVSEDNGFCQGVYVWDGTEWQSFDQTIENPALKPSITVTDIDGNVYPARWFGNTCNDEGAGYWMTQNLRVTQYPDGTSLGSPSLNSDYCAPNEDDNLLITNPEYGYLYTGFAANYGSTLSGISDNDPNQPVVQGICPDGWHLPSDYEWSQLEKIIARNPGIYSDNTSVDWDDSWFAQDYTMRGTEHGKSMKSKTAVNSFFPTNGLSNTSGFEVLLTGFLVYGAPGYSSFGDSAYFTSSSINSSSAYCDRSFANNSGGVRKAGSSGSYMYSVRCKKDSK